MRSPILHASRCAALLAALVLAACAGQPEMVLEQHAPGHSAIGIDITLAFGKVPTGYTVEHVYFMTEPSNANFGQYLYRSNYSKDGRVYLLNVPPGSYVAVAAAYSIPMLPPMSKSETTLFSKELAERTRTSVAENEFAAMGSYTVEQSSFLFHSKDALQNQVFELLQARWKGEQEAGVGTLSHKLMLGAPLESTNGAAAREAFRRKAKTDLAGSSWTARIR